MARWYAPEPVLEGGAWDAVFGKFLRNMDHRRFEELAEGTKTLDQLYDRVLALHPGSYEDREFHSVAEWHQYMDEEGARLARLAEVRSETQPGGARQLELDLR